MLEAAALGMSSGALAHWTYVVGGAQMCINSSSQHAEKMPRGAQQAAKPVGKSELGAKKGTSRWHCVPEPLLNTCYTSQWSQRTGKESEDDRVTPLSQVIIKVTLAFYPKKS